jgi:hypothetical protein
MFCLLLAACGDGEPEAFDMAGKGMAPWQMWGNSQTITLTEIAGGTVSTTSQMNRISYKRPETWHWLFVVTVVGGTVEPDAYNGIVDFDITVGIGRSSITIPQFVRFQWSNLVPVAGSYGLVLRTTSAPGGHTNFDPIVRENLIDSIVAQDIQVNARVEFQTPGSVIPPRTLVVKVDSYWAPASHIRPDWFSGNFLGSEDNGT